MTTAPSPASVVATTPAAPSAGVRFEVVEARVVEVAPLVPPDALEDADEVDGLAGDRAAPGLHRPARDEDDGHVGAERAHQHPRHDLVAVGDADEAVEPVRVDDRLDRIGDHLARCEAVAHPEMPHRDAVVDADRVELERNPARLADRVLDDLAEGLQVDVPRDQIDVRVADANERLVEVGVARDLPGRAEQAPVRRPRDARLDGVAAARGASPGATAAFRGSGVGVSDIGGGGGSTVPRLRVVRDGPVRSGKKDEKHDDDEGEQASLRVDGPEVSGTHHVCAPAGRVRARAPGGRRRQESGAEGGGHHVGDAGRPQGLPRRAATPAAAPIRNETASDFQITQRRRAPGAAVPAPCAKCPRGQSSQSLRRGGRDPGGDDGHGTAPARWWRDRRRMRPEGTHRRRVSTSPPRRAGTVRPARPSPSTRSRAACAGGGPSAGCPSRGCGRRSPRRPPARR